jgi:hypothetical protein
MFENYIPPKIPKTCFEACELYQNKIRKVNIVTFHIFILRAKPYILGIFQRFLFSGHKGSHVNSKPFCPYFESTAKDNN